MNYLKKSALIIDDDIMLTKLFKFILKCVGLNSYIVNDGFGACEWIKYNLPDIILCDILMPDMDGMDVLSYIKSLDHTKSIPVLAVTALTMPGDKERILTHGFDAYIPKPININNFTKQILGYAHNQLEIPNE
jgi:CheY-like chemotaxis protein